MPLELNPISSFWNWRRCPNSQAELRILYSTDPPLVLSTLYIAVCTYTHGCTYVQTSAVLQYSRAYVHTYHNRCFLLLTSAFHLCPWSQARAPPGFSVLFIYSSCLLPCIILYSICFLLCVIILVLIIITRNITANITAQSVGAIVRVLHVHICQGGREGGREGKGRREGGREGGREEGREGGEGGREGGMS